MITSIARPIRVVGRYALYDEIASGGMATVHLGRLVAAAGFSKTVAIKRLHASVARDPEFATMFLDEARLAARINHPNVIQTLDVVALDAELFLVMEYVHGEALSNFMRQARRVGGRIPVPIATQIMCEVLHGLHAAHEAKNERGEALDIVHRDVSPQNVLVGTDGVSRVFDFGVAKSVGRRQSTRAGVLKGKLGYMAPEQFRAEDVTRRSDVFAAGIVLWEAITGRRLFGGGSEAEVVYAALESVIEPVSALVPGVPAAVEAAIARALERDPEKRFATAEEMAVALEGACPPVPKRLVVDWVRLLAPPALLKRAKTVEAIESASAEASLDDAAAASPRHDAPGRPCASVFSDSAAIDSARSEVPAAEVTLGELVPSSPAPRWRRVAIAAGGLAAAVVAAAVFYASTTPDRSAASAPPVEATAAPSPPTVVPPAEPAPAGIAMNDAEKGPAPAAAPSATESASVAPSPAAPRGTLSASGARPAASASASASAHKRVRADELLGRD